MTETWNTNIPLVTNIVSEDLTDINENFTYLMARNGYLVDSSEVDQGAAGSGGSVKDYVDAIGTTKKATLFFPHLAIDGNTTTYTFSTSETIPVNIDIVIQNGALLTDDGSNATLAINGPVRAGSYQIFNWGNGSGAVTLGSVSTAFCEWWGFAEAASAAVNATALQATIDSTAPIIKMLSGSYSYDTTLTIDRAIIFEGSGSCQDNGVAGDSTTALTYTGTSHAIGIVGSGANGKENIHLSNFQLIGGATADGGINIGTTGYVHKSSYKNIHIKSFSQAVSGKGYGIRLQKVLTSVFENVYTQSNYDGWANYSGDTATSLKVLNGISRSNANYGVYFVGTVAHSDFFAFLSESNVDAGLYLYGEDVYDNNFYGYYGENNNTGSGVAPIILTGSGGDGDVKNIHFYSPHLVEYGPTIWTPGSAETGTRNRNFKLDFATGITIHNPFMTFYLVNNDAGDLTSWMEVTANTTNCSIWHTNPVIDNSWIFGYSSASDISVNGVRYGTFTATMTAGTSGTITLSYDTCTYLKVGSQVTVYGQLTVGSVSSPVGILKIAGLPYVVGKAVGAAGLDTAGATIYADNLAATATTSIMAKANIGSTTIQIDRFTAGQIAAMAGDVKATTEIAFTMTYHTE